MKNSLKTFLTLTLFSVGVAALIAPNFAIGSFFVIGVATFNYVIYFLARERLDSNLPYMRYNE